MGEQWVHLTMKYETPGMLKGSNTYRISLYVNGEFLSSEDMGCEIMPLSTSEIYIGAGSGERANTDFFYGSISGIEIYDIALSDEEIKEIYLNPKKFKIRNFGEYKSSQFLYTQILPELTSGNSCIDLGQRYNVKLNNIYLYKETESFKSFLPKPYRRDGRFKSLKHKSNSSKGNRWVHDATRKNQLKYYNEIKTNFVDFRIDGLNTLRFKEVVKEEEDLVTQVKIEL